MSIETFATIATIFTAIAAVVSTAIMLVTIRRYNSLKKTKAGPLVAEMLETKLYAELIEKSKKLDKISTELMVLYREINGNINSQSPPRSEERKFYGHLCDRLLEINALTEKTTAR